jgi:hypothetical protein
LALALLSALLAACGGKSESNPKQSSNGGMAVDIAGGTGAGVTGGRGGSEASTGGGPNTADPCASGAPIALPPDVVAERMAAFLYDGSPDAELVDAARAGRLGTTGGLLCAARRMLAESRSRHGVARMFERWLGVWNSAGAGAEPSIPDTERNELEQATRAFVVDTFFDRSLGALYTDERGAPDEGRAGLLTEPLVLLSSAVGMRTAPSQRGLWVSDKLLCRPVPPEPGAPTPIPASTPPQPVRVIQQQALSSPSCAACHYLIDPFGYALEHFDALGNFRNADDFGFAIDATGSTSTRDGQMLVFDGARELGKALAGSSDVRDCAAESMLEAALASFGGASFDAALEQARRALAANLDGLPEFAAQLTINPAFLAPSLASDLCGADPSGCRSTGCAAGLSCYQTSGVCRPSSCTCDGSSHTWKCAVDCDGGACGVGGGCLGRDPGGCSSDLNCPDGQRCATSDDGACIPRGCVCDQASGAWTCASECGGGTCVPR